jgi:L-lactate dehydrogenase (cytochrome)
MYHPPELVDDMLPGACVGAVEPRMSDTMDEKSPVVMPTQPVDITPLSQIINLDDIERAAERQLPVNGWAYYASAADDEFTKHDNRNAFQKIYTRPRILRDVGTIDTQTKILGFATSMPVFVSPAAMAKLAHLDGECAIAAAAGNQDVIQVVSTSSSMPIEKIMEAKVSPEQPIFFQLYVHHNRQKAEALIRRAEKAGAKALWVTVDAPVMGKRERDERVNGTLQVCP